jgi:hypothetical protein
MRGTSAVFFNTPPSSSSSSVRQEREEGGEGKGKRKDAQGIA